jgi:hypothetical protein
MTDARVLMLVVAGFGAIAAFFVWLLVRGVKRGVWNGRGVDVYRSERPFPFWFGIVFYGVAAGIFLSFPLYVAWVNLTGP